MIYARLRSCRNGIIASKYPSEATSGEYYLVGGTAIALHIGHRRSVDFDMFKETAINHKKNSPEFQLPTYNRRLP